MFYGQRSISIRVIVGQEIGIEVILEDNCRHLKKKAVMGLLSEALADYQMPALLRIADEFDTDIVRKGLGAMKYQNEIIRIIKTIIPTASKIDYIEPDHKLIDIGIDSVSFVRLLGELEKHFRITFPDEYLSISKDFTVGELCVRIKHILENRAGPIFCVDYFSETLDETSENSLPYRVIGNPTFIYDAVNEKNAVLSLPNNSAVGYLFNNKIYDQISNEMSLEILFYYDHEQTKIPNIILGNHAKLGGFCLYEMGMGESYGGLIFSVCTCFANVTAKALRKECLYLRGKWHHVIGTFQNGTVKLYINGNLEGSSLGNGGVVGEIMHTAPPDQILFVGGNVKDGTLEPNTDSNIRVGFIRIYNTAFDDRKVKAQYEQVQGYIESR